MNETTKTAAFVGSAVAMLLAAVFTSYANQPKPSDDFETIGQPFYADFEGTSQAKSLVVTSVDPDTIKKQKFEIKQVDGLWQIPSHDGYPAEAAERLARTSASLVGLTRDSLVGRRTSDYEKFGVVDPRNDDIVDIESVGQSVTLRDANEDVLVDLIIGDQADEDQDEMMIEPASDETFYYVRRADETNVYRIPLNIELSTKFSDWIEPDLLQMEASDVVQLEMNNYQIEERSSGMFGQVKQLMKVKGDEISLSRDSSTDDWELGDLKPDAEKLDQAAVNAVVGVLDDMAIVDVEKKPTLDGKILLDANLNYSVTPAQAKLMSIRSQSELDALSQDQKMEFQALQMGIMELQRDLESKGFSFGQTGQQLELVSAGGEMRAGTSSGLRYTLHVGKAPTNTTDEIDVAGASDGETKQTEDKGDAGKEEIGKDGAEGDKKKDASEKTNAKEPSSENESDDDSNRYVLIRVAFDDSLLSDPGETPVAPKEPVKPQGYTEASDEGESKDADQPIDSADDKVAADGEDSADSSGSGEEDEAPKPIKTERDPAFVKYDKDLAAYEEAQVDYELALSTYEAAVSERESQVKIGKKKAEILNGRFEKWYYIVSSENLKTLQSSRAELTDPVEETKSEDEAAADAKVDRPDVSFPVVDTQQKKESSESEEATTFEKPSVEKPEVKTAEEGPAENGDGKMEEVAEPDTNEGTAESDDAEPEDPAPQESNTEDGKADEVEAAGEGKAADETAPAATEEADDATSGDAESDAAPADEEKSE